jgi:hypothetical protein
MAGLLNLISLSRTHTQPFSLVVYINLYTIPCRVIDFHPSSLCMCVCVCSLPAVRVMYVCVCRYTHV